ncbi:hypothetical protein FTO74_03780 [Granulicella sp. WH15]|uniref:FixH family protein n=1 Tax=Granulicella sp. WH15 TaxID=2602070 RepID=UPI001366DCA0|nr:FixH family protein [Granulicella sp. WH15]QHN02588.1 hypothetical protein FTO74_03780 [Granulicella sp. WH15]
MRHILLALAAALLFVMPAHGDGGRVQMHASAGPYMVTLFSTPDTLTTGPADLSIGVEDAATGEFITDAEVRLTLNQLDAAPANKIVAQTAHGSSARGILQAAQITFPRPGRWRITIDVNRKGRTGQCTTDLTVGTAHQQTYEIWATVSTPLLICLLFVIHERRKRQWKQERTIRSRAS